MGVNRTAARVVFEIDTDRRGFSRGIAQSKQELTGFAKHAGDITAHMRSALTYGAAGFTAMTAAVAGTAAAVVALGQRGALVSDVAGQFESLTRQAGATSSVMLGALQRGTVNTISNFELMKMANKALGSGLVATASDFETLSAGARLLAKRTGGDTAEAFDSLTSAMASGRTAQLKQLGLFVDSKAAVEAFARAHRMSVSDMTDAHRAAALQAETVRQLSQELRENAVDAADFGERIDQLKTRWRNFTDDLAVAVANAPALQAALDGIVDGIDAAFGADQAARVRALIAVINDAAQATVTFAELTLESGRHVTRTWTFLKDGILGVLEAQFRLRAALRELIPVERYRQEAAELRAMADSLRDQAEEAWQSQLKVEGALNSAGTALERMRARMEAASRQQTVTGDTTAALTGRTRALTAATDANAAAVRKQLDAYEALGSWARNEQGMADREARAKELADRAAQEAEWSATLRDIANRRGEEQRDADRARMDEQLAAEKAWIDTLSEIRNKAGEELMAADRARMDEFDARRRAVLDRWRAFGSEIRDSFSSNIADMMTGLQTFHDGVIGIWRSIRTAVANVLQQMLNDFVGGFLKRMTSSLAGARLGQAFGQAITGGATGALRGGGAAAAGSTAFAGMAGAGATAGGLGLAGGAAGAAGGVGAGGTAAGVAGGIGMGAMVGLTAGIGGAALLAWGIIKKGWFRGGEEGINVNPRRDKFLAQFGGPGTHKGSGFQTLAEQLSRWTRQPGGGPLFEQFRSADSKKKYDSAQAAIVAEFARHGKTIRSFAMGGFVPPGVVQPAVLHGGAKGELIVPMDNAGGAIGSKVVNVYVSIGGVLDRGSVREVFKAHIIPEIKTALFHNQDQLATAIADAARP